MKKNLKIFWLFATYSLKTTLHSPIGVALFLFGKIIRFSLFFLFVFYLISNTKLLAGYTLQQTIIFYLTFNIIDSLSQLLFREVYRFRPLVISGEFDAILLKPYHPFVRVLVGGVDFLDLILAFLYAGIIVFSIFHIPSISMVNVLVYIALIFNAILISASFHIAVLAFGIISTEVDHSIMIYRDITKMGSFPIDIYQQPIRFVFTYILPIGIMLTTPVKGLFNLVSLPMYIFSFAIAAISLVVSLSVWNIALRKYQSWGG